MRNEAYRALPDEDHRFTLGTTRGSVAEFFAPTSENAEILQERRHWLTSAPEHYAGLLPIGESVAEEFCRLARDWIPNAALKDEPASPLARLIAASRHLEPDVVLLREEGDLRPITVGGCVCFPSKWSLPEKLGLSVAEVHDAVPGMNAVLQGRVDKLLQSLKPGEGWVRSNWSAEASPDRNQHPLRPTRQIASPLDPNAVWLRREHQLLFRLPETGGIVFGIRLELTSLGEVQADPEQARRWVRSLQTMPDALLHYKRLLTVRDELVALVSPNRSSASN